MDEVRRCPECDVPEQVTKDRTWLNSGVIVQSRNMAHRACFIESENLDPIYNGVAEIIGMPVDRFVVNLTRKGTGDYIRGITTPEVKNILKSGNLNPDMIIGFLTQYAELSGYGKHEYIDSRFRLREGDYMTFRVTNPYSILTVSGALAGACETLTDNPFAVDYHEIAPNVYEIKCYFCEHPKELEERLHVKDYLHRDGDIYLERCATCSGPKALSDYKWHDDRGTIKNDNDGRRMVIVGPYLLDPILEELQKELGEDIAVAVVDMQRRFFKGKTYLINKISDEEGLRIQLALRGLGNLSEIKMSKEGLHMHIDNAANYLMIVGLAQALFEMSFGLETHAEWELSKNNDLDIEVVPRR
jgi:hypothetical protein